ncbi:hypothetical protein B0H10DRAFT_1803706, partial [Mycena sp. CBHHK59/15]
LGLSVDPMLMWNYDVMAGLAGARRCAFWLSVRRLDTQEDVLNSLSVGHVGKDADTDLDLEELGFRFQSVVLFCFLLLSQNRSRGMYTQFCSILCAQRDTQPSRLVAVEPVRLSSVLFPRFLLLSLAPYTG